MLELVFDSTGMVSSLELEVTSHFLLLNLVLALTTKRTMNARTTTEPKTMDEMTKFDR